MIVSAHLDDVVEIFQLLALLLTICCGEAEIERRKENPQNQDDESKSCLAGFFRHSTFCDERYELGLEPIVVLRANPIHAAGHSRGFDHASRHHGSRALRARLSMLN
jgi:hypothetical protein